MGDSSSAKVLGVAAASAAASSLITYAVFRWHHGRERAKEAAHPGFATPPRNLSPAPPALDDFHPSPLPSGLHGPRADPYDPRPRAGYLSWDDYFMAVAFLSAQRSKDPAKQVGACIVDRNKVICGIGYNGFPRGCPDAQLPWSKRARSGDPLATKYPYVCHAEMNAVLNKNGASVAGATVYVTMFPCNECAKLLIQAGVGEIVFHEDKAQPRSETPGAFKLAQQYAASKRLLSLAGIKVRQHLFARPVTLVLSNAPATPAVEVAANGTGAAAAAAVAEDDAASDSVASLMSRSASASVSEAAVTATENGGGGTTGVSQSFVTAGVMGGSMATGGYMTASSATKPVNRVNGGGIMGAGSGSGDGWRPPSPMDAVDPALQAVLQARLEKSEGASDSNIEEPGGPGKALDFDAAA